MKRKFESIYESENITDISYDRMMQSLNDTIKEAETEGPGPGGRRFLLSDKITSYVEDLRWINNTLTEKTIFDSRTARAVLKILGQLIGNEGSEEFLKELFIKSPRYLLVFCHRFCKWVSDNLDKRDSFAGNQIFSDACSLTKILHDKWIAIYFNHLMNSDKSFQIWQNFYIACRKFIELVTERNLEHSSAIGFISVCGLIIGKKGSILSDISILYKQRDWSKLSQVVQRMKADGDKLNCIFGIDFSTVNKSIFSTGPASSRLKDFKRTLEQVDHSLTKLLEKVEKERRVFIDDIYPPSA